MSLSSNLIETIRSVALFSVLAVALSGCDSSPSSFQVSSDAMTLQTSQVSSATSGGNGDYYGGKPAPGIYQRYDASSVIERLKVTEKFAEIQRVDDRTGNSTVAPINFDKIEFATYLPGRVGFGSGLYTKISVAKNDGVSEAWCRKPGSTGQDGYDVVVERTLTSQSYKARITETLYEKGLYVGDRTALVQPISQDRNSGDRVRYRAEGFELEIRFETFNSVSGKFQGRLRFDQHAQVDTAIDCRVGGALENQIPSR
jgi:hypothetical protein